MKILWVNPNFLHPTTKGGQIRTLEMLKCLHRGHEIDYAAFENPAQPEGVARSTEYCARAYPFHLHVPDKRSPAFLPQLASGLFHPVPLAVSRFTSAEMSAFLQRQIAERHYDLIVCDFLAVADNFPALNGVLLFQHNVETLIWRRRVEQASDPLRRWYLGLQARRMFNYEGRACRQAAFVVAVSQSDEQWMRANFGATRTGSVPTGVDTARFAKPASSTPRDGLVFVGSMDWMPNVDGVLWFAREVLPRIRARLPGCRLTIAGRDPDPALQALASSVPGIIVTGTVPDIRPYLWDAAVCIVPLRVGGGTRLKIFEAMAAGVPVVSTAIGAEGLPVTGGRNILIAGDPEDFAAACWRLLQDHAAADALARDALHLVTGSFSWEEVARRFEALMEQAAACRI